MKIALQMYSIRACEPQDLLLRLEKVKEMGFDAVEFAGFGNYDAQTLRNKLDAVGLVCQGSHTMVEQILADPEGVLSFHKTLGASTIVCPFHKAPDGGDAKAHWLQYAKTLNEAGKLVAAAGMQFGYHNHSHEFADIGGTCAEDIIFQNTDPAYVKMQLDTCWVENAGFSAVDVMNEYKSALSMLHIKELTAVGDPTAKIVGTGCIEFPAIVALAKKLGVQWYTIEHEATEGDIYGDITKGLHHLRNLLK